MTTDPVNPPVRETRIFTPVIAGAREVVTDRVPPVQQLFATIVEASFDLIDELGHISLCLYLHAPHDDQPSLYHPSSPPRPSHADRNISLDAHGDHALERPETDGGVPPR